MQHWLSQILAGEPGVHGFRLGIRGMGMGIANMDRENMKVCSTSHTRTHHSLVNHSHFWSRVGIYMEQKRDVMFSICSNVGSLLCDLSTSIKDFWRLD
ncbi:hypothetical protein EYC80_000257 [Monilinia laxa]|uniref:Uncharacterized protein n=1 Tax=Monilinia laxa TaxID=61186 RepID=A0A5N6KA34_MONLA|nr:hypothetical protein EYC80_000257 [Monilinia laxa]